MHPISVRCLLTGGTIDICYHQRLGKTVIGNNVEKILNNLRFPHLHFIVQRLFKIDSRKMTEQHRAQIINTIQSSCEKKILITHGTDTLVKTACYLHKVKQSWGNKVVVITGAMVPYGVEGGIPFRKKSDAEANIISALTMLEVLRSGVWIVFHGRKLNPLHTVKDYSQLTLTEK